MYQDSINNITFTFVIMAIALVVLLLIAGVICLIDIITVKWENSKFDKEIMKQFGKMSKSELEVKRNQMKVIGKNW